MLLPRILTAVVGVPLVLLAIFWGGIPFLILMTVVVFFSLREYFIIASRAGYGAYRVLGVVLGIIFFVSIFVSTTAFSQKINHQFVPIVITIIIAVIFLFEILRRNPKKSIERIGITFLGVFFIPWAFAHLARIYYIKPHGRNWIYLLFLTIWVMDAAAYFFGMKFGKRQLASAISPKKSLEGLLAAIISAGLFAPVFSFFVFKAYISPLEGVVIGCLIAVLGQFSDLSESLIKRDAEIKDSDTLLPGHGGMLDRFDSFLFTAPLLYYYILLFK